VYVDGGGWLDGMNLVFLGHGLVEEKSTVVARRFWTAEDAKDLWSSWW
jgi:hypothetical protein